MNIFDTKLASEGVLNALCSWPSFDAFGQYRNLLQSRSNGQLSLHGVLGDIVAANSKETEGTDGKQVRHFHD